jgi:hypothetical protein
MIKALVIENIPYTIKPQNTKYNPPGIAIE